MVILLSLLACNTWDLPSENFFEKNILIKDTIVVSGFSLVISVSLSQSSRKATSRHKSATK